MIAQLLGLVFVLADTGTQRGNQGDDLLRRNQLVETSLLDIQDFSLERQNGLELPVSPCFAEPPAESPSTR
jgi:hypothetical protein